MYEKIIKNSLILAKAWFFGLLLIYVMDLGNRISEFFEAKTPGGISSSVNLIIVTIGPILLFLIAKEYGKISFDLQDFVRENPRKSNLYFVVILFIFAFVTALIFNGKLLSK